MENSACLREEDLQEEINSSDEENDYTKLTRAYEKLSKKIDSLIERRKIKKNSQL